MQVGLPEQVQRVVDEAVRAALAQAFRAFRSQLPGGAYLPAAAECGPADEPPGRASAAPRALHGMAPALRQVSASHQLAGSGSPRVAHGQTHGSASASPQVVGGCQQGQRQGHSLVLVTGQAAARACHQRCSLHVANSQVSCSSAMACIP
jgi:hypothetical protein